MMQQSSSGKTLFWGAFVIFLSIFLGVMSWSLYFAHYNPEDIAYDANYQKTAKRFQIDWPHAKFEIALPPTYSIKEQNADFVIFEQSQTRSADRIRIMKASQPLDRPEARLISLENGGQIRYVYTLQPNPGSGGDDVLVIASLSAQNHHFSISCSLQSQWSSPDKCLYFIRKIKLIP